MKNKIVIYLSELLLLIYIIIFKTIIMSKWNAYIDLANILFFSILALILYFTLGYRKKRSMIHYSAMQTMIICFIFYYFLTYFFGMFFGFLSNSYSLKILSILKNVIFALLFYGVREFYRFVVIKNTDRKKISLILVTLLLAVLDIIMGINAYTLTTGAGIFEFVEASILPKLALSIFLTYTSYHLDLKFSILFLVLYELPKYFLPIFPDMGSYIGSMVKLIFLFICYYQISILMERYETREKAFKVRKKKIYLVLIVIPILALVALVSGVFKYHLFAIGSNSMIPYFSRGDAVLIKKLNKKEMETLKVDDVIAFTYNHQIIVHRIVSIEEYNGYYSIKTKGDNNDSIDGWTVTEKTIYGKVETVVKYIGIPSVELSELMN